MAGHFSDQAGLIAKILLFAEPLTNPQNRPPSEDGFDAHMLVAERVGDAMDLLKEAYYLAAGAARHFGEPT